MNNTAKKLTAKEITEEFNSLQNGNDLLRVFLITGATDISKSSEMLRAWSKNSTGAEKEKHEKALKTLQAIEHRRVELTAIMYGIDMGEQTIDVPANEIIEDTTKDDGKVLVMLPTASDIIKRVEAIFADKNNKNPKSDAFKLMNTTFGVGKVLDDKGNSVTFTKEEISRTIKEIANPATETTPVVEQTVVEQTTTEEPKEKSEPFGFGTIYNAIKDVVEAGANFDEVKAFTKNFILGKHISGKADKKITFFVEDEAKFEDYWERILSGIVNSIIKSKTTLADAANAKNTAKEQIEQEVIPFLQEQDKDDTVSSFAKVTQKINGIYSKLGINMGLSKSLEKAQELAQKYAPNLLARNKKVPVEEILGTKKEESTDIYDDSHNIKESNKDLWAKVKDYSTLEQIFSEASALVKDGNWKDALNMCILLITDPNTKVKEKWDSAQVKQWFNTNVLSLKDSNKVEESPKPVEQKPTTVIGPVPVKGSIDSKERAVRMLNDVSLWKDKYEFTTFEIPTDNVEGSMLIQVVNADLDKEKDLLITPANMEAYISKMRDLFVETPNNYPIVKTDITNNLAKVYNLTSAEVKRIVNGLKRQADEIRKQNKISKKYEQLVSKETEQAETTTENEEVQSTETPFQESSPQETNENQQENVEQTQESTTPTENAPTEEHSNSNNTEGFEEILKASNKLNYQKAVYDKIMSYPNEEEGVKAVFNAINPVRKNKRYKKNQINSYKMVKDDEFLASLHKILRLGKEAQKSK